MKAVQSFLAAIVCFTRIPIPWTLPEDAFTRASLQLPLLGWILGGIQYGVFLLLSHWVTADVALFWALIVPILLSGGMHEDGLADFADGMLGGQTPSRRLEIMKDPRVGSYGVLALIIVLGGSFLALKETASSHQGTTLLVSTILSRSIVIPLLGTLPYLNHAGSRSEGFIPRSFRGWYVMLPLWPLLPIALLLPDARLFLFFLMFMLMFIASRSYLKKKLGGLTGDCLGAAIKLTEFSCLMLGSFLWPLSRHVPGCC
jgi:adenosylcobinamide-GDP ribazoletransferase